jgi:hypothetical protein
MATRVFLCPNTGGSENGGETYQAVNCLACRQVHMINPKTGKVLGTDEETN